MEALSPLLTTASDYLLPPVQSVVRFVALSQPQNPILRYSLNATRLFYLANVIVGLAATPFILLDQRKVNQETSEEEKKKPLIYTTMFCGLHTLIPCGGFILGIAVYSSKS